MISAMPRPRPGPSAASISACVRTVSQRRLALASLLLFARAASGRAEPLSELLAAVAANARFTPPVRVDVRIECQPACKASRAIFLGRDDTLRVEVKDGMRALVGPERIVAAEGDRSGDAPPGKALADTSVLLEDLRAFVPSALKLPQISDEGPEGVVVTSAPARVSAYALLVLTIDREQRTIVKTQYYRDSISNLDKVRRDSAFASVGGHWRPGAVTFERMHDAGTTRLTLTWREAGEVSPTLFDPAELARPSGLDWQ
jgi:hypothetical protein